VMFGSHLFGMPNFSQVGLELVSGVCGSPPVSQCNVAWRSFLWARGSGCWSFDSPMCFISAKCGSSVPARFLIHGAHAVCFCTLVAIVPRFHCIVLHPLILGPWRGRTSWHCEHVSEATYFMVNRMQRERKGLGTRYNLQNCAAKWPTPPMRPHSWSFYHLQIVPPVGYQAFTTRAYGGHIKLTIIEF
jgi:hypothetical protein